MNQIKIKCPAKINLTLEIVNKREDGFHNIKSIMQMISLYDYLTISVKESTETKILLSGTSTEIPYDEKNLVYKAAKLFLEKASAGAEPESARGSEASRAEHNDTAVVTGAKAEGTKQSLIAQAEKSGIDNLEIDIFIEKNIPIAAGLAGGSTDAAGTLFGLNCILEKFSDEELHKLCAELGSDLNVCLSGGCNLATSRGEVIKKLPSRESDVTLIKPVGLGISAGEAYKKYSQKELKPQNNMTENMLIAILDDENISEFLYNDLEYAVFDDYKELQKIKESYPKSIMSGSGSTYFMLENLSECALPESEYQFINNLKFVSDGVGILA